MEEAPRSLRELAALNRWKEWKGKKFMATSLPDKLVVIAKRRYLLLEEENKMTHRADAALLNDRLITAETIAEEEPERAESIRRAAQTLYGEKGWARPLLINSDTIDDAKTQSPSDEPETTFDAVPAPENVPETTPGESLAPPTGTQEINETTPESVAEETIPQESENEE